MNKTKMIKFEVVVMSSARMIIYAATQEEALDIALKAWKQGDYNPEITNILVSRNENL